jgi:N-acetylglucosamine kinase-like BadF-type ATPase
MALIAAVDGGGTKTAAVIAGLAGGITLMPPAAGCNPQDGGPWAEVLGGVLDRLAATRGLAACVLGLPGYGEVPAHDAAMRALVADRLPCPHRVLNDVELAWHGAFPEGAGVLLLSGTGSMAMAGGPRGLHRTGGWGDLIGDEGSAFWIGQQALTLTARAADGRLPEDPFAPALLDRVGADPTAPFAPLAWLMAQSAPRAAIAGVAAHVDALAEAGDGTAQRLLSCAGGELAALAKAAGQLAGLGETGWPWAAAGSVFRSARVMASVTGALGPPGLPAANALGGGLRLAAEMLGHRLPERRQGLIQAATRCWAG